MKQTILYKRLLNIAFWFGVTISIVGALFAIQHWPYGHLLISVGRSIIAIAWAIVPFLPSYRSTLQRIQVATLYWGLSLLFISMSLRHMHFPNYLAIQIIPIASILISGIIYLYMLATGQVKGKMPKRFARLPSIELLDVELDTYTGVYANKVLPLILTFKRDGGKLIAQATNQQPFLLIAIGSNIFRYDKAGIVVEFDTSGESLMLYQHGSEFPFVREGEIMGDF
jgi:hypothetical protein